MDREQYCFLLLTAAAAGHLCNSRDEAALLNKLSGGVLAVLAALPNLTSLFLRDNRLAGRIPEPSAASPASKSPPSPPTRSIDVSYV